MNSLANFNFSKKIWLWLFPIAYVVHISEEYWGGEGYSAYMARTEGVALLPAHFLILTSTGCALVIVGMILAAKFSDLRWIPVIIGTAFLLNGVAHTIKALLTWQYNPGLVSGALLWIPLGAATLVLMRGRTRSRTYWITLAIGVCVQGIVSLLARTGGKLFGA